MNLEQPLQAQTSKRKSHKWYYKTTYECKLKNCMSCRGQWTVKKLRRRPKPFFRRERTEVDRYSRGCSECLKNVFVHHYARDPEDGKGRLFANHVKDPMQKKNKKPRAKNDESIQKLIDEVADTKIANKKSKVSHYVNNVTLFDALVLHRKNVQEFKEKVRRNPTYGHTKPRIPEYVGECILMIAERLSSKPNFANYTYKEEMISDGIENCLTYLDNFDPEKSKNPFAYLTQIIYYAFLRRISREKKQTFVKLKLYEKLNGKSIPWMERTEQHVPEEPTELDDLRMTKLDIDHFEQKTKKKKSSKKSKKTYVPKPKTGLEEFFET
jgi:hypothetical protein